MIKTAAIGPVSKEYCLYLMLSLIFLFSSCGFNQKNAPGSRVKFDIAQSFSKLSTQELLFGHEVGNGGAVIKCSKNYPVLDNKKLYLLDFYIGKQILGSRLKSGLFTFTSGDSYEGLSSAALESIKHLDTKLVMDLDRIYESYEENLFWESSKEHYLEQDSFLGFSLPGPDCKIFQIGRFVISATGKINYFRTGFTPISRTGANWQFESALRMHEVLYSFGIDAYQNFSALNVMLLNYLLHSELVESISADDLKDILKQLGFRQRELLDLGSGNDSAYVSSNSIIITGEGNKTIRIRGSHNLIFSSLRERASLDISYSGSARATNNILVIDEFDSENYRIKVIDSSCFTLEERGAKSLDFGGLLIKTTDNNRSEQRTICGHGFSLSGIIIKNNLRQKVVPYPYL